MLEEGLVGARDDVDDGVADSQHVEGGGCHEFSRVILKCNQVHARLGLFQQGHDARDREGNVGAQAGAVDAERAQAHFAYDEARAKLDAGLQQGLEVADAALAVQRIARPVVERAAAGPSGRGCRPW